MKPKILHGTRRDGGLHIEIRAVHVLTGGFDFDPSTAEICRVRTFAPVPLRVRRHTDSRNQLRTAGPSLLGGE